MAVTLTVGGASVVGAQRQVWGTLAVTSDGGAFSTGLKYVNSCEVSSGDTEDANGLLIELNTAVNGDVTLTCTSGEYTVANFKATGYGGG
tara:strand:- start:86 stop:355 length:270 start_codon:yes stop_codon:yes gene_type:complete